MPGRSASILLSPKPSIVLKSLKVSKPSNVLKSLKVLNYRHLKSLKKLKSLKIQRSKVLKSLKVSKPSNVLKSLKVLKTRLGAFALKTPKIERFWPKLITLSPLPLPKRLNYGVPHSNL
jgi:hypothetical protein